MTDRFSIAKSVRENWAEALADDGFVSAEEGNAILAVIRADGKVTDAELADVLGLAQEAAQDKERILGEVKQSALQAGLDGDGSIGTLERLTNVGKLAEFKARLTAAMVEHLEKGRKEVASRVDPTVSDMSYGLFDWAITDGEAKASLERIEGAQEFAGLVLTALAAKESGLYLKRLLEELPTSERSRMGDLLASRCTDTVLRTVRDTVGDGHWSALKRASGALKERGQ